MVNLSKNIPLEATFRSVIQAHKRVRYAFLGSKTHIMSRMFGAKSRPFYNSALSLKIGKPPIEDSVEFLTSRFAGEGMEIPADVTARLLELSENIPYFLQAMASLSYQSAESRHSTRIEQGDLDVAVRLFIDGNEDYYEEILRNLAEAQYLLTEALASEPAARFDENYRNRHRLGGLSTLHSAIRGLLRRGVIDMTNGMYAIADPFFARFVRERSAVGA